LAPIVAVAAETAVDAGAAADQFHVAAADG